MRAVIIAPVHEPVLRFGLRITQPLVGHAAGDRLRDRLAEVALALRLEIADEIGDVGWRQGKSGECGACCLQSNAAEPAILAARLQALA